MPYRLAQINIGKARAEMDDPVMHGFVSRLDELNALAEAAPGFIWRLQTEAGDATALRPFGDPLMIVNVSLWESVETLKRYTYSARHLELLQQRKAWFVPLSGPHLALWWLPEGKLPTVADAKTRLEHVAAHGPSARAFDFGKPFAPPP